MGARGTYPITLTIIIMKMVFGEFTAGPKIRFLQAMKYDYRRNTSFSTNGMSYQIVRKLKQAN